MTHTTAARSLSIGIDARFIQDKFHGIGRYTYHVLRHLCCLEGNHTVTAFVDPKLPNSRFPLEPIMSTGRLTIRPISISLYHPGEWLAWRAVLHAHPVDVFHSPYFWSPLLLSCPLITTIHDMIFDRYPAYMPQRRFALVYRVVSRLAIRRAQRVIAVSEATKRDIVAFTHADATKVCVVPEGVESTFRPETNEQLLRSVRQRYGLPAQYVLALGARRPHKNIARLVEAFQQVAAEVPHTLVLVGAIDDRFALAAGEALVTLKRSGRLVEIGYVDEADLPALYSMADLFVQPSIIEGFGLPVAEAMACGCPVACSNVSSMPEVAGGAALLFDPLDTQAIITALHTVLHSSELRADLVERGLRRASVLSWEQAARQTLNVYQEVSNA